VTKLLTVKRSAFFVAFLALALVGMAFQQRVPTAARGKEKARTHLSADDRMYAEGNVTFSVNSGTYDGKAVTFRLARSANAAAPVVEIPQDWDGTIPQDWDGSVPADIDPNSYADVDPSAYSAGERVFEPDAAAGCSAEMMAAGKANQTTLTIETAGRSLPLKADTYLPITLRGRLDGNDVDVDTTWSGTVLARAGFSADNPVIEMPNSKIAYSGPAGGVQTMNASAGNGGFSSIKFKTWKSNVKNTQNITEMAFTVEMSGIQYDAASGTLNVKQRVHLKKSAVNKSAAAE